MTHLRILVRAMIGAVALLIVHIIMTLRTFPSEKVPSTLLWVDGIVALVAFALVVASVTQWASEHRPELYDGGQ